MNDKKRKYYGAILGILAILLIGVPLSLAHGRQKLEQLPANSENEITNTVESSSAYLPMVLKNYPWLSSFGVEARNDMMLPDSKVYTATVDLGVNWVRINNRISWRMMQPSSGADPLDWSLLTNFEEELRAMKAAGLTPIVVIDDYPHWAVMNVRDDETLSSCAPIKQENFLDFANFVRQIVTRYSSPEFDVHYWELGNEPDVDPDLVAVDNEWGCWGNDNDPSGNYGGYYYGQMIKIVAPVIKVVDPNAQVWIGGLLLDRPDTPNCKPEVGQFNCPENFLRGILEAGAADYFDVVPYHSYPPYLNKRIDHDTNIDYGPWNSRGGGYLGKASFLRDIMDEYGVNKPLFINETGLMCRDSDAYCNSPSQEFFQMQADFVVRSFVRSKSAGILGAIWYRIDGPGWRYTGLLDGNADPRPVYNAYQQLNTMIYRSSYIGPVNYGSEIEAYSFQKGNQEIQIIWTKTDITSTVSVAKDSYIEAWDEYGNALTPVDNGTSYQFSVGFSPIYLILEH